MDKAGRVCWWLTALVVLTGIVIQLFVTSGTTSGHYKENPEKVLNVFAYFTVQSNLILGGTALLLALGRGSGQLFRVIRLDGVVCIAVTGAVYHLILAPLSDLSGWGLVATHLLHTVSPLLGVLGWLIFGPRGRLTYQVAGWSLVFPLLWLAFTLVRGAPTGFYPYPFVDVIELGYGQVLLNCLLVAVLFLVLAFGAVVLDRRLQVRTTVER